MNETDWGTTVATIAKRWRPDWPPKAWDQLRDDLAEFEGSEVAAAVDTLNLDGREFAPTGGQIARRIVELRLDAPSWGDAKRQLIDRHVERERRRDEPDDWTCPYGECDGSGFVTAEARVGADVAKYCRCRPERIAARRQEDKLHPLLREFVNEWATYAELEDILTMSRTAEAQLRGRWEQFVSDRVSSELYATVPGDSPRLIRARDDRERGGLRRLGRRRLMALLPGGKS